MKVVIAYDGSTHADAVIADLPRAGLPHDAEVIIALVADLSAGRPAASEFDLLSAASRRMDAVIEKARRHNALVIEEAKSMASVVVDRLKEEFPKWKVDAEVLIGDPADELLRKVREWNADLVIAGSQGRSAIGRFFLGSVSKSLAEQAVCSVRIVRSGFETAEYEPTEVIIGVKNLAEAGRIVKAIAGRVWPENTNMRLVAVDDESVSGRFAAYGPGGKSIYEIAADRLAKAGTKPSVHIKSGDPTTIFFEAADVWRANSIIVGSGEANVQRLDETTESLVTGAKCTVEIVR